jgi:ketosteroid isomerase-like protein
MLRPRCRTAPALAVMFIALTCAPPRAAAAEAREPPEAAIHTALEKWTADFNAGNAGQICDLFAFELRYDYRGHPERNYRDICGLLQRSLEDRTKSYAYALEIKEVLVSGELAVVRLVWTLRIRSNDAPESVQSVEPGMDIFRKQADGNWKIIRYIAYEE